MDPITLDHSYLLISITGHDKPGITSVLASILARHEVRIHDIEQVTSGGNLTLTILIELQCKTLREHPVFKDLIFAAWELDVQADFRPITKTQALLGTARSSYALTMFGDEISAAALSAVAGVLASTRVNIDKIQKLSDDQFSCIEMMLSAPESLDLAYVKQVLLPVGKDHGVNLALQRESVYRRAKRLIVLDVDSTLIEGEMIDELALRAGVYEKVADLTRRAMAGDMDFEASLRQRVALLEGLPIATLADVRQSMKLTPGSRELIHVVKRLGYKIAIISGGFTYFTNSLRSDLELDFSYANELEIRAGRLTGGLLGVIVDGRRKADLLETIALGAGVSLDQVIAVGDGANDLHMLKRAGLGIAFNAKKSLRDVAEHAIDSPHLDAILYLLGIRGHELKQLLTDL